jgi:hypothetical protein
MAAWLGVRVANRKKVRWQSIATHESGGLSPFRGHSSALNAYRTIIIAGGLVNSPILAAPGIKVDQGAALANAADRWKFGRWVRVALRAPVPSTCARKPKSSAC